MQRLRADVRVSFDDSTTELFDERTGLNLELEGKLELGANRSGAAQAEVWQSLGALGLLEEGLSDEEIRARQRGFRRDAGNERRATQLRELLEFASAHVPFYRDNAAAWDPALVGEDGSLAALPLLSKADVRAQFPHGLLADTVDVSAGVASRELEMASTSGTTGERLQTIVDMELDSVPEDFRALWRLEVDDEHVPRTAVFTSPTCLGTECHLGRSTFEERVKGEHTLFLNSTGDLFSLKRPLIENVAEELDRFRPDFLFGNPVYLHWLARKSAELGIKLHRPKLILSSYQYLSNHQRRALEQLFEAKVYAFYSATELGGCRVAVECRLRKLHVREDQSWVEVVRRDGAAREGEVGALAVTAHAARVMPLIRYLVGDVGRLTGEECSCELSDWAVLELHGRARDLLRLQGRWVSTREVDDALADVAGIDFYQCRQSAPDELTFKIIPEPGAVFRAEELEERMKTRFGVARVKTSLTQRLDPEPSLKFRLTASQCETPPDLP